MGVMTNKTNKRFLIIMRLTTLKMMRMKGLQEKMGSRRIIWVLSCFGRVVHMMQNYF